MKIQTEFSFFDEQGFGGESPQHAGNTLVRRSQAGVLPLLGILLANRLRFAGSDCHGAGGFELITPYPAIVLMLLYCGGINGK